MGRPKKEKNPFADLPVEFVDEMSMASESSIRERIAKVSLDDVALREAQAEDQDLAEKKEQAKLASEPYRLGFKANRLKIEFMKQVLQDKGKAVGSSGLDSDSEPIDGVRMIVR